MYMTARKVCEYKDNLKFTLIYKNISSLNIYKFVGDELFDTTLILDHDKL